MRPADSWKDYELLDATGGNRLERWGETILIRPDPQVVWKTEKQSPLWAKADAIYHRSNQGGGEWEYRRRLPEKWKISCGEGEDKLTLIVSPTGFKHTGVFPEQAVNWAWYARKIRAAGRPVKAYKELFRALEAGETPILFHCSGGKDRTGVAAMLILLALGASDETICQDFVRTNVCRRPELEKIWAAHAEEIEAHPEQKQFYQGIAGVHPESAPFVLDTIRKEYGTTDAYLEAEYGLTPARLMRLRRMYLE